MQNNPSNGNILACEIILWLVRWYCRYALSYADLQQSGVLPKTTKLRQVKYLNNSIENDHKSIKRKSRYRQWYQSFGTASATIDGMETMRMIQKGQIKYILKNDIRTQNTLINKLFGLAA